MKKRIHRLAAVRAISAITVIMATCVPVHAQFAGIYKLAIDCNVLKSGDAVITEKWDMNISAGTEVYKSFYNMHQKDVSLESVTDEKGVKYQNIGTWNTSASRTQKKYRCGINTTDKGKEICIGIGSYGHKVYTMKYRISRFMNQYKDTQGINYTFFSDMDIPVLKAVIKVRSAEFTPKPKVWSFGYSGDVHSHYGYIEMASKSIPKKMQLLAETGGHFTNTDKSNASMTFSQIRDDALRGSSYQRHYPWWAYVLAAPVFLVLILNLLDLIFFFLSIPVKIFLFLFRPIGKLIAKSQMGILGPDGRNVLLRKVHPYRDIPDATPDEYMFAAEHSDMPSDIGSVISGCLMSWYIQGAVEFIQGDEGKADGIRFLKEPQISGNIEESVYSLLRGCGERISSEEFHSYCKKREKTLEKIERNVSTKIPPQVDAHLDPNAPEANSVAYGEKYFEKAQHIYGLYKFLRNKGNMKEKQYIEASQWKEYLVAASFFGIADRVRKQMEKFIPDMNEEMYTAQDCCSDFSYTGCMVLRRNRREAERLSRTSGEGSSSSLGGGGGFSAGGGGGGVR